MDFVFRFFCRSVRFSPDADGLYHWPLQSGRRGHTVPPGQTEPTKAADLDIKNDNENDNENDIDNDNENDDDDKNDDTDEDKNDKNDDNDNDDDDIEIGIDSDNDNDNDNDDHENVENMCGKKIRSVFILRMFFPDKTQPQRKHCQPTWQQATGTWLSRARRKRATCLPRRPRTSEQPHQSRLWLGKMCIQFEPRLGYGGGTTLAR